MYRFHNIVPQAGSKRLAVIVESPGSTADTEEPFDSGTLRFVKMMLSKQGINPNNVMFAYYCNTQLGERKIYELRESEEPLLSSIETLKQQLFQFQPNCVLVLGEPVMRCFGENRSLENVRGSILWSDKFNCKYVPTFAPLRCFVDTSATVILTFDIQRAIKDADSKDLNYPFHDFVYDTTLNKFELFVEQARTNHHYISLDIEGRANLLGVTCMSLYNLTTKEAISLPLRHRDGSSFYALDQELILLRLLRQLLEDPEVPKVLQNAFYDSFVIAHRHGILIRGIAEDTMMKQWELFCELPKDLGFISTMWTREPYYKDEMKNPDERVHQQYNLKDSLVTGLAAQAMDLELNGSSRDHYRFNIQLLRPYLYMGLRGCKVNKDSLHHERERVWQKIVKQQLIVNNIVGYPLNVKSPKQMKQYFYEDLKLDKKFTGRGEDAKLTANFEALTQLFVETNIPSLLEIIKLVKLRTRFSDAYKLQVGADGRLHCSYNVTGADTGRLSSSASPIVEMVTKPSIKLDKKGIPILDYDTGEDNLGTNMQNQTKALRKHFVPDSEDFLFWQYDLSGADAWTVAAELNYLGAPLMMEHLLNGIKPSAVITLINRGEKFDPKNIPQVKALVKTVAKDGWQYICSKRVQHGTNYGMMPELTAAVLLKDSVNGWMEDFLNDKTEKETSFQYLPPSTVAKFQNIYSNVYSIDKRRQYYDMLISKNVDIVAASGSKRHFYSYRGYGKVPVPVLNAALSQLPQHHTTYITNMAAKRIYYDRENRTRNGFLVCDLLVMVHDALAGQIHKTRKAWMEDKVNAWFDNPITILDQQVKIPAEGKFGNNWGEV